MTQHVTRARVGYYLRPDQPSGHPSNEPADDICVICGLHYTPATVRTRSLMGPMAQISLFVRMHKACADLLTHPEDLALDAAVLHIGNVIARDFSLISWNLE